MKPFWPNERKRCAPQLRITASISARSGARRWRQRGPGLGMLQLDGIEQVRHRLADRGPVRRGIVAGLDQRGAQPLQLRRVVQFGKPGPAQQRPQRRIAQRRRGRICSSAGRRHRLSAAGDRRRRTATGRPCGPSARSRRRRRSGETSWIFPCGTPARPPKPRRRRENAGCPPSLMMQVFEKLHE